MIKRWQLWLGAGISAIFLIYALWGLKLGQVWENMTQANYIWIIPGVLVYFLAVLARTWRWHYLLRPIQVIPVRSMWSPVVIGYMGNNILPFRAGEVVRAYVLKRNMGVSIGVGLATVLVERVFDGLVMLIFVLIGLPRIPDIPLALQQTVIFASIGFSIALIVLGIWAVKPALAQSVYTYFINRFAPQKLQARLLSLANNFTEGLQSLTSVQDVVMIFVTSIVIWLLETVKYWFVTYAFAFTVSFFTLMLMNGVVNLATTLPSAPGYIGTFDTPGIEVLTIFGIDPDVAAAYTLVLHAALWLPVTLLGLWYMYKEGLSFGELRTASNQGAGDDVPAPEPMHSNREG
ncbi:MAG: lysylphosphatidylglycerol synthase transmembrane domain-containing protein [Chloroflexota bacterium]